MDDLDMLRIVGSSLIGRLQFAETPTALASVPSINLRSKILRSAEDPGLECLLGQFAQFSGVSGVQAKCLIRDDEATKQFADGFSRATHILKSFDEGEFPGLALNEWFCLQAAKKAGLATSCVEVSSDGKWLAVERFDLVNSGENSRFLAFEDMCSLSGRTSAEKYTGSYEEIAGRIRTFSSAPAEDLRRFFLMMAVSCALRNGDAHKKNFGMLYERRDTMPDWLRSSI